MRILVLVIISSLFLAACSPKVPTTRSAGYYFKEGERLFEKGLYEDAVASFEKVRDSYYSPELNILAELKIAEAYYQSELYVEAAAAYELFLKNHPDNEKSELVLYYLGTSYYKQVLPVDRDQTAAHNTIVTFRNLLKLYPETKNKQDVEKHILFCRNRLARHEIVIGRFYVRTEKPQAAIGRLEAVFDEYPEFTDHEQTFYLLGQAYLQLNEKEKAVESFNNLHTRYPNSKFVPKAQKRLSKYL